MLDREIASRWNIAQQIRTDFFVTGFGSPITTFHQVEQKVGKYAIFCSIGKKEDMPSEPKWYCKHALAVMRDVLLYKFGWFVVNFAPRDRVFSQSQIKSGEPIARVHVDDWLDAFYVKNRD